MHWLVAQGRDSSKRWVLRRYGERETSGADWEGELLSALSGAGWPVAAPTGVFMDADNSRWAAFPLLPGRKRAIASRSAALERGRDLALLHAAIDDLGWPTWNQRPHWVPAAEGTILAANKLKRLESRLTARLPGERQLVANAVRAVVTTATRIETIEVDRKARPIHGDFMPWNLLYAHGRLTGVLDFEKAHLDVTIADLAFACWGGKFVEPVLAGYAKIRKVTNIERSALEPFWRAICVSALWSASETAGTGLNASLRWAAEHLVRPWGA